MKGLHFGWPSYLALTIGIVAIIDFAFDLLAVHDFTWGGVLFFAAVLIVSDFFSGNTPSDERREEEA